MRGRIREQELTTIGYEKKTNPLLQKDKHNFIKAKVKEKLYTPPYFKKNEKNNQEGPDFICKLPYLKP